MSDDLKLPAGKTLRPMKNFVGKAWEAGQTFTKGDIKDVPLHILKALENNGKIQVYAESPEGLEPLEKRINLLEAQVADLSDMLAKAGATPAPAKATPAKKRGRPRKDS
jgi:hypothetical protein